MAKVTEYVCDGCGKVERDRLEDGTPVATTIGQTVVTASSGAVGVRHATFGRGFCYDFCDGCRQRVRDAIDGLRPGAPVPKGSGISEAAGYTADEVLVARQFIALSRKSADLKGRLLAVGGDKVADQFEFAARCRREGIPVVASALRTEGAA